VDSTIKLTNATTFSTTPIDPTIRARAKALKAEVNPFLN
jgi:hypothetical protein